ncbi:MAG: acyloxyacyl hydrolase [Balneolaceae bacterium]
MSDTRLVLAGLEVIHTSFRIRNTTIRASTQLVLFGKTDFPKNGVYGPREQRNGFGLIPFKASIPLFNSPGSYPYLSGGLGFLLFSQKFPNNDGTRFNATLEAGAGYQIYLGEQVSLDIEYRFHHMSNGETGQVNPGIDSNLFTAKLNIKI